MGRCDGTSVGDSRRSSSTCATTSSGGNDSNRSTDFPRSRPTRDASLLNERFSSAERRKRRFVTFVLVDANGIRALEKCRRVLFLFHFIRWPQVRRVGGFVDRQHHRQLGRTWQRQIDAFDQISCSHVTVNPFLRCIWGILFARRLGNRLELQRRCLDRLRFGHIRWKTFAH